MAKFLRLSLTLLVIVTGLAVFSGCDIVTGSGETQTFEMDYTKFTRVEINAGFDVKITRADSFFVSITIDKSLYEYLNIAQRGDTLYIGLKSNHTYTAVTREGIITLPDIRRLDLSGGAKARVTGFSMTHNMDFVLSGGSQLTLEPMQAADASFKLSGGSTAQGTIQMTNGRIQADGGSRITLTGTAKDIEISASGGSSIDIPEIQLTTAGIDLDGASNALIRVSDVLDVKLGGGSDLRYYGSPKLGSIDVSGGAKFSKIEP